MRRRLRGTGVRDTGGLVPLTLETGYAGDIAVATTIVITYVDPDDWRQSPFNQISTAPKMNRTSIRIALALFVATTATITATAQPLSVRAKGAKKIVLSNRVGNNQFTWNSDAPLEKIQGTAEGISGSLTLDPANPSSLRGTISAKVATMKSGNDTRDEHLRSETWLNAAKHPEITFVAGSVSGIAATGNSFTARVTGDFTMNGVTKRMTVPVTVQYLDASSKTRSRAPGDLVMVTADFSVSLRDFNVAGSKGVVGSKVGETIEITAKLFGSTAL